MIALGLITSSLIGATPTTAAVPNGGPYNASFLEGGVGIQRELPTTAPLLAAGSPYTMSAWVRPDRAQPNWVALIALGAGLASRCLALDHGKLAVADGARRLVSPVAIAPGRWTLVTATSDGHALTLFVAGRRVASAEAIPVAVSADIAIAPPQQAHFAGSLVAARVDDRALAMDEIAREAASAPDFDLVQMTRVGIGWEFQKTANTGLWQQQDAWTLPHGQGGVSAAVAKPVPAVPVLQPLGTGGWQINGWRLIEAEHAAGGAMLSRPGVDTTAWYAATVPGTVLTTLVDRGVYPDPYYGLNNLAIPEKLARQDYWYRTSFVVPGGAAAKRLTASAQPKPGSDRAATSRRRVYSRPCPTRASHVTGWKVRQRNSRHRRDAADRRRQRDPHLHRTGRNDDRDRARRRPR